MEISIPGAKPYSNVLPRIAHFAPRIAHRWAHSPHDLAKACRMSLDHFDEQADCLKVLAHNWPLHSDKERSLSSFQFLMHISQFLKSSFELSNASGRFVRRLCENSRADLNDGMISAFVAEAFHGSVYRGRRSTTGDAAA